MNMLLAGLLSALFAVVCLGEWHLLALPLVEAVLVVAIAVVLFPNVTNGRRAFAAVAALLSAALWWLQPDAAPDALIRAAGNAGMIGAYFCALATLQYAAGLDPSVTKAGRFLASQPPGRRYLSLTFGSQLYSNLLGYGAVTLLGSLASANAQQETNPEIRYHRRRRMLLAIHRGFCSVLTWSPLTFSTAVILSFYPALSWFDLALPGIGSSVIIAGTGWALDTVFKPKLTTAAPPREVQGTWALMMPMVWLFLILAALVATLYSLFDVRIVAVVMIVVPALSVAWMATQRGAGSPPLWRTCMTFLAQVLPGYKGELMLLMSAGYIGAVAAPLMAPYLGAGAMPQIPPWLMLIGLVWLVPLLGQIGANPLLSVALIISLLPAPETLGASATAIGVALICGWALCGMTSPFTANTVLVARLGEVPARKVGLGWNGPYALITGGLLSLWVVAVWAITG
ncbi:hypothetical protein [Pseudoprimorskyibacter insulae]|uniref:Uncharacterized protein n=1 Tax=Pseudoprimorskyibacter insulae TaxID=1695997 RepID=A0A2R8B0I0_9RHOB|nr:hypothetical protein [Pseudoprimorskyibacter insulae]SPF81771.1 hypothetical protein PRI8871_03596 [Pseudoprimorskyibacter insulae]